MNIKKICFATTNDGSPTIWDEAVGEHHHSMIGAYTEAKFKFASVALIILEKKTNLKVLDLPFGLGYNLIATLDLIKEEIPNSNKQLSFVAIEKDVSVIEAIAECPFQEELKEKFKVLLPLSSGERFLENRFFSLDLKVGDLIELLPDLQGEFDLIFYDAFSPKSSPGMWSKNKVLYHLSRLLSEEGLLITYTASNKVRKGLQECGLFVSPGPAVGRRMPGTIASKSLKYLTGTFSEETVKKIAQAKPYE